MTFLFLMGPFSLYLFELNKLFWMSLNWINVVLFVRLIYIKLITTVKDASNFDRLHYRSSREDSLLAIQHLMFLRCVWKWYWNNFKAGWDWAETSPARNCQNGTRRLLLHSSQINLNLFWLATELGFPRCRCCHFFGLQAEVAGNGSLGSVRE